MLCMKYKGLNFNNVFESEDFVFLPIILTEDSSIGIPTDIESYTCKYDSEAEFYVLLKNQDKKEFQIDK